MRMQITVDEKTKEVVERIARIVGVSQSCVFSYGINCICNEMNTSSEKMFKSLYDYTENYYKVQNKQGGRNEKKKKTLTKKSKNLSDSRWLQTLKKQTLPGYEDNCECNGLCDTCTLECK